MHTHLLRSVAVAVLCAGAAIATTSANAQDRPLCGLGTGEPATGEPIKLGAIVGETGPDDFSSTADAAGAYFDCVNANGGINGRPIEYLVEDDQWNPEVAAQAAARLVDDEGVLALVASASFVEAVVNAPLYAERGILVVPSACATSECFEAKNMASTNAGPVPSNLAAAQWAVDEIGTQNVACIGFNIPSNGGWSCDIVVDWLKSKGLDGTPVLFDPAAADFTSVVLEALASGADTFLLNLPAGAAIGVLKAAEEQDMAATIKFIAPTPLYDVDLPGAIGPYWDGRLHVNIELTPLDGEGPDAKRWRAVMDQYGADHPRDTFSQAGFMAANILVDTLMQMDSNGIDRQSVTDALLAVKAYETDLACTPWYFGPGDRHIPIHTGMMTTVKDGGFEVVRDCYRAESAYLDPLYALEKEHGLGAHAN